MACSCSSCHYHSSERNQCGWMGDVPPQPGGDRCRFVPLEQYRVPKGLVIAKSSRVVSQDQLAEENAAHGDQVGGSGWGGY